MARRRLLIAVSISLFVHGVLTVSWLAVRPEPGFRGWDEPTAVEAPDDREMVMNILQLPVIPAPKSPSAPSIPPTLPPTSTRPMVDSTSHSGVTQTVHSPPTADSLPKSSNSSPLHGKLKSGKSIVYVLDRSSSMGTDGRLARACAAIKASLDQLNDDCRFQIVAYNGAATSLSNQLLIASPTNRERAGRWLDGLIAEGRSEHRIGFREALWLHSDAVFLLTDADDMDEKEVKAIRGMMREPVFISVTLFAPGRHSDTPLARLIDENGGRIQHVK